MADSCEVENAKSKDLRIWTATSFIFSVSIMSIFAGFGYAVGRARKRSPQAFDGRDQEGARLAAKALGYGTLLSVAGVGSIVLAVKTMFNIDNAKDFGEKMRRIMPQKDGELDSYFKNWRWRIPRKNTNDEEEWERAMSDSNSSAS